MRSNVGGSVRPLGRGQSWQDLTGSRALSTVYTNTTGREIALLVTVQTSTTGSYGLEVWIDGVLFSRSTHHAAGSNYRTVSSVVVPKGATYEVRKLGTATQALHLWSELR